MLRLTGLLILLFQALLISGQICPDTFQYPDALIIEDLGKSYQPHPSKVPANLQATVSDRGGTTSVRRINGDGLIWKEEGYYQRNRELGQCFNIPADTSYQLEAIVLRTGNSSNAVKTGAPGAEMYLQFFEVLGQPIINDNGTPPGTSSTHGFNTNHRTDDFLEGVTYQTIGIYSGGTFPDFEPTSQNGGQSGHLRYMRWSLKEAGISLDGGRRYAFMVGFLENGPGKSFSLGNENQAGSRAAPELRKDDNGTAWWSIRREGDGTLPPTQVPGEQPPQKDSLKQALIAESLYQEGHSCSLSPTTDGFPDVDTYRALEFYIEVANGCPVAGTPCDDGDSLTIEDAADGFCGCFGKVPGGCSSTGTINYERYDDLFTSTATINALKQNSNYPANPDENFELSLFEAPINIGERFGVRMSGYICPPLSGSYIFYISGDDATELNLSTDKAPSNRRRIAYNNSGTPPREWGMSDTQKSRPIFLQSGEYYYIEALMKTHEGDDHLAVAWELPNGIFEAPIPGTHLSSQIECPQTGTPCDDGLDYTINDQENGNCDCEGENTCPPIGSPCDDGNSFTLMDIQDGNCNCQGTLITSPGLQVSAIGKSYQRNPSSTPDYLFFDRADQGGSTSVRNVDRDNLSWKEEGYFQRNRDLGQTFSIPEDTSFILDAIVLRTGNSSSAVKQGALFAEVYLQLFEVLGEPSINDNGTLVGATSKHGFTPNHRADDYLEGIEYRSILIASEGLFPAIGPTDQNGGQTAHLHYLRWDLIGDNEIRLEGGRRYAFLVGFAEAAPERRFTLGNQNLAADPAPPSLRTDALGVSRWSMRREGDGTLPPTQHLGENPPANPQLLDSLLEESLFSFGHQYTLPPATDGWPDVDTYRTLEFYIETKQDLVNSFNTWQGQSQVKIFPNPSNGTFLLQLNYLGIDHRALVEINDLQGGLWYHQTIPLHKGLQTHQLRFEHQGLYVLTIRSHDGIVSRKLMIK